MNCLHLQKLSSYDTNFPLFCYYLNSQAMFAMLGIPHANVISTFVSLEPLPDLILMSCPGYPGVAMTFVIDTVATLSSNLCSQKLKLSQLAGWRSLHVEGKRE